MKEDEYEIISPQAGPQEMAVNIDADVILCSGAAGSSKSYSLLLRMLRYMHDKDFEAIYFRRETSQLLGQGGLVYAAADLFRKFGAEFVESKRQITFKLPDGSRGARAKFMHMEHEKNRLGHQGLICSPFV